MKIKKILRKIDYSKIVEPAKYTKMQKQIDTMYWNLWGQFGLKKGSGKDYNIADFSWTESAKRDFYAIPFHKKLMRIFKIRKLTTSWILDCEPADIQQKNRTTP
jgi:hypothetical protein